MEETREQKIEAAYHKLVSNLEDLTKIYRTLLDLLRKEKELLVQADIEKLNESNQTKEACLYKLRAMDAARERYGRELAGLVGADVQAPRLLEIAQRIAGAGGDRLRTMHSTLELLVRRVHEINRENEQYAKTALNTLNGALGELKETLAPKKTYGRNAKMAQSSPDTAGNFASKEA
jgi:hypothetical protein